MRSFAAVLTFLLLASCATLGASPPRTLTAATTEEIDRLIEQERAARHIAGLAMAVVTSGQVRYAKGYGFADLETRDPVRRETSFLIASITKMFTAVGTMQLVRAGKLQLDAPIGGHLKEAPAHWRGVTVRQLLTHTSGINSFTQHEKPPCPQTAHGGAYTRLDVIAEVACLPLDFEPGSDFAYSDTGYLLLGLLIERASGETYAAYLQRNVFAPAGMRSTHMMAAAGDDRAVGYGWDGRAFARGETLDPVVEGASGGLVSTVDDLARFDWALAMERLLPIETVREMQRPTGIGDARYGMGFSSRPIKGRPQVGHTGGGPGASTSLAHFTEADLTVIILTNTAQPPQSIQEIVNGLADLVLGERD